MALLEVVMLGVEMELGTAWATAYAIIEPNVIARTMTAIAINALDFIRMLHPVDPNTGAPESYI